MTAVYDVTRYIHDHPGGADVLLEALGQDASEAFDSAGHSEDANEIMVAYHVGSLKGGGVNRKSAPRPALVTRSPPSKSSREPLMSGSRAFGVAAIGIGAAATTYIYIRSRHLPMTTRQDFELMLGWIKWERAPHQSFGFVKGMVFSSSVFGAASSMLARRLSKMLNMSEGFQRYPAHKSIPQTLVKPEPLLQRGWLDPSTFHALPLVKKDEVTSNVYFLQFALPTSQTILGLPTGQHVAIKAVVNGQSVQRSYTPISNNSDQGVINLIIRSYPDGLLTGGYLAKLEVGDEVLFRGPKGAMRYERGLCKKIGMLAGGTGITPMYQLIRAICEDDRDTTEISLIYANRSEQDILLRGELETFARRYPQNLKIYYLLDQAPAGWKHGTGYVTQALMAERFPSPGPDSKIMLCGPPGMVNAAKKSLAVLGFEQPKATTKMTDQIFCF